MKDFAVSSSHPAAARDINIIPPAAKRNTAKEVFFMQERLKDKNVKQAVSGMLLALAAILSLLKIPISESLEIRFGSIPIALAGALYGPGYAACVGALSDIVGYWVKPTGHYFPGFTLSGAVSGVIFGLFLYVIPRSKLNKRLNDIVKKIDRFLLKGEVENEAYKGKDSASMTLIYIIIAVIIHSIVVSMCLDTIWLSILYKKAIAVMIVGRVIKALVMIPIYTGMISLLLERLASKIKAIGYTGK